MNSPISYVVASQDNCFTDCLNNPSCQAFQYGVSSQGCYLFNYATGISSVSLSQIQAILMSAPGFVIGYRIK